MDTHTETNEQWTFNERHTRLRNYEPTQVQSEWWSIVGIGNEFALDVITPSCVSRERNVQISRLIAAAPELLEAAQKAQNAIQRVAGINDENRLGWALQALYAAIAKATEGAQ